jgi:hypothetical protein
VDGIIERFGKEVYTITTDKEHLSVKTTVSLSVTFFGWVVYLNGRIKLTFPDHAV